MRILVGILKFFGPLNCSFPVQGSCQHEYGLGGRGDTIEFRVPLRFGSLEMIGDQFGWLPILGSQEEEVENHLLRL